MAIEQEAYRQELYEAMQEAAAQRAEERALAARDLDDTRAALMEALDLLANIDRLWQFGDEEPLLDVFDGRLQSFLARYHPDYARDEPPYP